MLVSFSFRAGSADVIELDLKLDYTAIGFASCNNGRVEALEVVMVDHEFIWRSSGDTQKPFQK